MFALCDYQIRNKFVQNHGKSKPNAYSCTSNNISINI